MKWSTFVHSFLVQLDQNISFFSNIHRNHKIVAQNLRGSSSLNEPFPSCDCILPFSFLIECGDLWKKSSYQEGVLNVGAHHVGVGMKTNMEEDEHYKNQEEYANWIW